MGDSNEKGRISRVLSPPAELVTNFEPSNQQQADSKESPSEYLPVRRSTRDIKRKKFDDELLAESTLPSKSPFKKGRGLTSSAAAASSASVTAAVSSASIVSAAVSAPTVAEKSALTGKSAAEKPALTGKPADTPTEISEPKPQPLPPVSVLSSSSIAVSAGIGGSQVQPTFAVAVTGQKFPPTETSVSSVLRPSTTVSLTAASGQLIAKHGGAIAGSAVVNFGPAHFVTNQRSTTVQAPPITVAAAAAANQNAPNVASFLETVLLADQHGYTTATGPPATTKKRGRQSKKSNSLANSLEAQEKAAAMKDMGRWQPTDDLALITAVMQVNDLSAVYAGVKFSCKFTLEEIQSRWYALLYDPLISKYAQEAMKLLPPEIISTVQSNTLFSREEEKLLASISSTILAPSLNMFEELLNQHQEIFHFARTARSLMTHWQNMKDFRLLNDQKFPYNSTLDDGPTFSDIEDNFDDEPTPGLGDGVCERELLLNERHLVRQIRRLENELPKWHVLVESVTGVATPDFDSNTIAALRGRMVRYLIRSREATIGRNAKGSEVDIDLSLEGPAFKISRKQGTIKLRATGDFYITNDGKRPFYVDGKPVLTGCKTKLNNNSVIEFACIRLLFMINQDLVQIIRNEGAKMMIA